MPAFARSIQIYLTANTVSQRLQFLGKGWVKDSLIEGENNTRFIIVDPNTSAPVSSCRPTLTEITAPSTTRPGDSFNLTAGVSCIPDAGARILITSSHPAIIPPPTNGELLVTNTSGRFASYLVRVTNISFNGTVTITATLAGSNPVITTTKQIIVTN
jgi:hypothetical protein